jgi:hypothetical protein
MKLDDLEGFRHRLRHLEPILLPGEKEGVLRVLDRSGLAAFDVAFDGSGVEEVEIHKIESVLSEARGLRFDEGPPARVTIHLVHEAIELQHAASGVAALSEFLGPNVFTTIIIHTNQSVFDYSPVCCFVKALRVNFNVAERVGIQLVAPFGEYREAEMQMLFDLGVRIRYAAGWISPEQIAIIDPNVLRGLSEFGFRVPILWYVHENNIESFESSIQNLLITNFSSGFSLPLICQNPYYQFEPGFPNLPDAVSYCELLTRMYQNYPHFDDIFQPLSFIALLARNGGWISQFNIPSLLHLIVDKNGELGLFRHSPALAERWCAISDVQQGPPAQLREQFLHFAASSWNWEKNVYCRECHWRHVCGGLDPESNFKLDRDKLDTLCGYRKLFFEHFANLRAPNRVVSQSV